MKLLPSPTGEFRVPLDGLKEDCFVIQARKKKVKGDEEFC